MNWQTFKIPWLATEKDKSCSIYLLDRIEYDVTIQKTCLTTWHLWAVCQTCAIEIKLGTLSALLMDAFSAYGLPYKMTTFMATEVFFQNSLFFYIFLKLFWFHLLPTQLLVVTKLKQIYQHIFYWCCFAGPFKSICLHSYLYKWTLCGWNNVQ